MQALAEQSRLIRLPLNRVGSINKINQAASMLEQELERVPTEQELADYLGLDVSEVKGALDSVTRQVSVDAPFGDDDSGSLLDVLEDKNIEGTDMDLTYTDSLRVEVERSLSRLSERERQVIKMFFGIGCKEALSLEQIGEILDLSTERVRQIKEKALSRLRMSSKNSLLAEYLG